ncbi:hypothetical protein Bca52824_024210 [Brassica carinata]|uniref:Uncharacterized protein n=1 Tax=Brassica carinata TaxID=52824 RepID=A0A8X8AVH8_BRACI|nr:hypothetical protein Bca52824_024210 [Brassica carinata]
MISFVVGKSVSSPPLSDVKELSIGDLAGTSSTETEAGFGISTVVAETGTEVCGDVLLSEEARVVERRERVRRRR